MGLPQILVLAGYASLAVELLFLAVPSVASTREILRVEWFPMGSGESSPSSP